MPHYKSVDGLVVFSDRMSALTFSATASLAKVRFGTPYRSPRNRRLELGVTTAVVLRVSFGGLVRPSVSWLARN